MKRYPNIQTLLFYFFSMFFLGGILLNVIELTILRYNPTIERNTLEVLVNALLQFVIYIILFFGIMILMKDYYKDEIHDFKKNFLNFGITSLIGWMSIYGLLIVYSIILYVLKYETGVPENQQFIQESFTNFPLLMIPVLVIGAPIIEETIFRGIIFRLINNSKLPLKMNTILAFILSAGIFGFIHVISAYLLTRNIHDIIDGIPYFISGFVLTFIYFKTRNIIVPILTHFAYNTAATVIMYLSFILEDFLPEETTTNMVSMIINIFQSL